MASPKNDNLPLAVTMGEPAGIGGELTLKSWSTARQRTGPFFVIDDPRRLAALSEQLGLTVPIIPIGQPEDARDAFSSGLPVMALSLAETAIPGHLNPANAEVVIQSIERAVQFTRTRQAAAVVTNPIQKSALYAAGFNHPGHTEFLADLCGGGTPVMMLACDALRAVPVTVHVALRNAISDLKTDDIVAKGQITADALNRDFGIAKPRLAVAGLNPHAGEDGTLGTEDHAIVAPAVARLKSLNIDAWGPVPPDALFNPRTRETYDAALCMYHDQALIPVKALDFDGGVNVTLGLSIVRTSPDHGTALDIAASGQASEASLVAAMIMARQISQNRVNAP